MTIKNLSQFKKWISKGNKIQFVENIYKPENAGGQIREVTKTQTNGLYTLFNGKDSWLEYPKSSQLKFNDNGTIEFLNKTGEMWLVIKPITA